MKGRRNRIAICRPGLVLFVSWSRRRSWQQVKIWECVEEIKERGERLRAIGNQNSSLNQTSSSWQSKKRRGVFIFFFSLRPCRHSLSCGQNVCLTLSRPIEKEKNSISKQSASKSSEPDSRGWWHAWRKRNQFAMPSSSSLSFLPAISKNEDLNDRCTRCLGGIKG